jgi:hypothetical protein
MRKLKAKKEKKEILSDELFDTMRQRQEKQRERVLGKGIGEEWSFALTSIE